LDTLPERGRSDRREQVALCHWVMGRLYAIPPRLTVGHAAARLLAGTTAVLLIITIRGLPTARAAAAEVGLFGPVPLLTARHLDDERHMTGARSDRLAAAP
jgi:hypothetical protein